MQLLYFSTVAVVPCPFARNSGRVGTSLPLPSAWQLPHLWLKLSLAYLTQAYVDFTPRQSEAGQVFEAGALCFSEASEPAERTFQSLYFSSLSCVEQYSGAGGC